MNLVSRIWRSSLGKKYVMAVSGMVLVGFVIAHLFGNLQIFLGPEVINRYGHFLQTTPELVWPARIGLLVMVLLHIAAAVTLARQNRAARPVPYAHLEVVASSYASRTARQNRAARPVPYAHLEVVASSYASRTMVMSGLIIFAFIVYHLLHFTIQVPAINLTGQNFKLLEDSKQQHDIYRMMVLGYQNPVVSGFYVLAIGLLCLHLSHGVSSMFQSLGLSNRAYEVWFGRLALTFAVVIFLGYCSIPAAVLLGIVK